MKREEKFFLKCLLNNMWNSWVVVLLLIFDSHFKLSCKEKNNKFDLTKYGNMILTWFIITIYKKLSKPIIKCLDISASLYNNPKSYNKCKITFPHILWKKNTMCHILFSLRASSRDITGNSTQARITWKGWSTSKMLLVIEFSLRDGFRTASTCKMELFMTIVNDRKPSYMFCSTPRSASAPLLNT